MKPSIMTFALLLASPAAALEVSLEENRAERGNIGYVDMQRLFQLYPETQKAKQHFEEVMRQAEEQVNIRKAELIGLRAELIKLRLEREAVARLQPPPVEPEPPLPPAPETSAPIPPPPGEELRVSTPPVVSTFPASAADVELSTPPALAEGAPPGFEAPASTETTEPPSYTRLPGMPDTRPSQPTPSSPRSSNPLADIDARIAERTRLLQDKENEFKTYQAQVEKNLLDLESRKTEILLGKIYTAVQESAKEAGVSVVVDKSQILFGHNAMDLTERVLKKLKS